MPNAKITALVELASGGADNADMLPLVDVSDVTQGTTGSVKRYSWLSVKNTLKTYFDTLYQTTLASTDALSEGATNLYFTALRVRATVLTGLSTATGTVVAATHTVLEAIGFLQKQASDNATNIANNTAAIANKADPGIPQNSQSVNYTLVLADANKHVYHPAADTVARTFTIPASTAVAFPIGTAVTFDNDFGAGAATIAITTDTLVLVGTAGSTGSRTLASGGQATALKVSATRWRIAGNGLT